MDNPKPFPILRLPFLAIEEVIKAMDPIEIINFSMISKRTKAVTTKTTFYSKYVVYFCVDKTLGIVIHRTNKVFYTYNMTSDKRRDGKTEKLAVFKYSKDPVQEWKHLCKHILEVFKRQTIDVLIVTMDSLVDHNASITDFLATNVKSVDDCTLFQMHDKKNVDKHTAYLLDNLQINSVLCSYVNTKNDDFNAKIPKNLKELFIENSQWIGYEKLLEINCKSVILRNDWISEEEWNMFFKKWIALETHVNLEYLELDYRRIEELRAHVLHDIPHEMVDGGVKRTVKTYRDMTEQISGGIDIKRIDGKTKPFPNNKFPILRLPFLAIEEIFKAMDPFEIINFSMTSKRAKAVTKNMSFCSKFTICLYINKTMGISIEGINNLVACTYLMTSDKQMDGKTEKDESYGNILRSVVKYTNDPVEEWKQLCIYVLEIFNRQTIDILTTTMDVFVDQNVPVIDFLKTSVKSVNSCSLSQKDKAINVEKHTAYFLGNIQINSELYFDIYINNDDFNGQIPNNLKELYIFNSHWIGFERLVDIDCKNVILRNDRILNKEWNSFIKKWVTMEAQLNLECLQLDNRELVRFRNHVLHDIPHEVVDGGVKRTLISSHGSPREISGGVDIRRIDEKTATFIEQSYGFSMSVH
ncbi:hypothetical protein CRE_11609 [Caenorhabditis remanei]|uniref:F-box domain-containing protein n=1 Tax=Caenorhabditis remanei TaxID=31234 RepID=E3NSK0_CAERE|nr:hypothetical protein CRE_11609 [Caenorhabditis remanei]